MRVLMLTWEFPPMITGGLGMACYGIAKALVKLGVEVDLIIPVAEEVYFPLRREADVDHLMATFADPGKKRGGLVSLEEIIARAGGFVSAYYTTGERVWKKEIFQYWEKPESADYILRHLMYDHFLFRYVRNYTAMAVRIARRLDFDVIHAHDWLTYSAGLLIKDISEKPLVTHVHATEFDRAGGPGDGRIHHLEYLGNQHADRVMAVSSFTASVISDKYKIDPAKIRIVHNAFTVQGGVSKRQRIFKEPTILFVGRITIQKGPDYFLEVARRVLEKEKNVRFVMAGSGDMARKILHKAASLGLGTKFLFAGFLKRGEVEQILSSADIFIMPSVSEPFGIVPLEAMSYGAVAVISKQSGVAEVIENAYKIDFWDINQIVSIILDLLKTPGKLRELSQKGIEEVAKLQWETAARKVAAVYDELKEE